MVSWQGRNHVLNIGGDQFLYIYIYIYALIDTRTHIITRTQRLVNTNVPRDFYCNKIVSILNLLYFSATTCFWSRTKLTVSLFVGTDKQMQMINTRTFHLSLSLSLKMGIFLKKSSNCFTEYNCRSFNISFLNSWLNINWFAASILPRSLSVFSIFRGALSICER